jgi:proteasome assembly chaperone (PAC2) family protein
MADLTWHTVPPLRRPILLMAFEGLFDAGSAATDSLTWIRDHTDSVLIAEIDAENFFDFSEHRPLVRLVDGERRIIWPDTKVWACRTDGPRDLVVMTGVEPHLLWRTYADQIVEIARRSGAEISATIGAMVAMVPHTRPFGVTGSAATPELADRLGLGRPSYEGPTGVVGVVNERFEHFGLPVISLRVAVPHYVPAAPSPKASRALLRRIQQITQVSTGYEDLDGDVTEWLRRVDSAVADDADSASYVARLERQVDSDEELLPSGDDLAAELEAFLRDRDDDT